MALFTLIDIFSFYIFTSHNQKLKEAHTVNIFNRTFTTARIYEFIFRAIWHIYFLFCWISLQVLKFFLQANLTNLIILNFLFPLILFTWYLRNRCWNNFNTLINIWFSCWSAQRIRTRRRLIFKLADVNLNNIFFFDLFSGEINIISIWLTRTFDIRTHWNRYYLIKYFI